MRVMGVDSGVRSVGGAACVAGGRHPHWNPDSTQTQAEAYRVRAPARSAGATTQTWQQARPVESVAELRRRFAKRGDARLYCCVVQLMPPSAFDIVTTMVASPLSGDFAWHVKVPPTWMPRNFPSPQVTVAVTFACSLSPLTTDCSTSRRSINPSVFTTSH